MYRAVAVRTDAGQGLRGPPTARHTSGEVVRLARGRYALPQLGSHLRAAHRHSAVLSHLSAAVAHGWAVKWPPDQPWLTVPRNRKMDARARAGLQVAYRNLSPRERRRGVTGHVRTVLDCALKLPFDEALCLACFARHCAAPRFSCGGCGP
ncbi:Transcriptional regulator, AbiEi antitoxin, Type IV TA system [Pedococcus dokdonensis]|uniref:Transcriptional regulator, AbiEi antitoxin, Type IV TA system n=1 Tax=Pedococcus dokdonensis TaxID=443156 RepID=A0A1H0PLE6_9MICO|nr:Transcriptional regulator, AbiEi antitoxin, Type IV TA system [Pedococcus dokdonensis]